MPLTPTATRDLLAQLGHQPKRFLGQNFLVDGNIVRKSLELAGIRSGETVVEIGPGLGTLTTALLEAGADVWAVEKDRTLHEHLAACEAVGDLDHHARGLRWLEHRRATPVTHDRRVREHGEQGVDVARRQPAQAHAVRLECGQSGCVDHWVSVTPAAPVCADTNITGPRPEGRAGC